MPSPRAGDTVAKALRRRAQLRRWSTQHRGAFAHDGRHASQTDAAVTRSASERLSSSSSPLPSSSATSAPPSSSLSALSSLAGHHSLQHAYQRRDSAQPSSLQRRLSEVLQRSSNKAETAEAFFLVARSDKEAVTPATFAQFTAALLRHNVAAQMGAAAYEAALTDAVGSADRRWNHVEPAESRAFALYQARRLERYSVKGTSHEPQLGLTLEGADNSLVALTQFQLQKHASAALPVPLDVLEELTHLDVSWSTALKVYEYAREVATVDPPASMTVRLMGLMAGYRTNGVGSRPWAAALELYERLLRSGYEVPLDAHAAALDAVWRRGDDFARPHAVATAAEQAERWAAVVRIRDRVDDAQIAGEAGCRFSEALVKACCAVGRWEAAVQVLGSMDVALADTSSRLLVPTAETFLFTMAACNVAGNAAHATALLQSYRALYTLRSAHPEALCVYLQSLRHILVFAGHVGEQVESLLADGQGLDRPCVVACLQLLSSQRVHTVADKTTLAQQLVTLYDSHAWPQQPQARQVELQTVFRCCHLIAAAAQRQDGAGAATASALLAHVKGRLVDVFGADAPESRWLRDTEVYGLLTTHSWQHALEVFERQVTQRPPERVAELPVPLRQARAMLAQALLRSARAATADADESFLLEEDQQQARKAAVQGFLAFAVDTVRRVYDGTDDTVPRSVVGELLLLQALHTSRTKDRQRVALEAMRELACGDASAVTPRIIDLVSQALALTTEHVEAVLVEGSAQLRDKSLREKVSLLSSKSAALERVFL